MYVQLISAVNDRPIFIRGHSDPQRFRPMPEARWLKLFTFSACHLMSKLKSPSHCLAEDVKEMFLSIEVQYHCTATIFTGILEPVRSVTQLLSSTAKQPL